MIKTHRAVIRRNLQFLHLAFSKNGVDTNYLYEKLGLNPSFMKMEDTHITPEKYLLALETAAIDCNDRNLGLRIASEGRIQDLGIFGYMIGNAKNIQEISEVISSYGDFFFPGLKIELTTCDEECTWKFRRNGQPKELLRQDYEMTAMQLATCVRYSLNDSCWMPSSTCFELKPPLNTTYLKKCLGSNILFDHHFSGITFSSKLLRIKNERADPHLFRILKRQVNSTIEATQPTDDLIKQVQFIIKKNIGMFDISAEYIAQQLDMSRRTLHRKLKESNITLNQLKEQVCINLAKELLSESNLPITEISLKLGYSNSSAFHRAFKRWTSYSPKNYRSRHRPTPPLPHGNI